MMDANDSALQANTPTQAKSLLYSLELVARSIGLFIDLVKTEFMCFKHDRGISSLNGKPLKLVDQFTYFSSIISSTESDANMHMGKMCTVIDRLSMEI